MSRRIRLGLVRVFVSLVILAAAATVADAVESTAVAAALPTATQLTDAKPPEFTADDEAALKEAEIKLGGYRHSMLTRKLSSEDISKLAAEAEPYSRKAGVLRAKRAAWQAWMEKRNAPSGRPPELSEPTAGDKIVVAQIKELYAALVDYQTLYRRLRRLPNANGSSPGDAPTAAEWEALAARLEPMSRLRMSTSPKGTARYIMRAALVAGECYLNASVDYFNKEDSTKHSDSDKHYEYYLKGISMLEPLTYPAIAAAKTDEHFEDHQLLPLPPMEYGGAEMAGADDPTYYPEIHQMRTSDKARQVLADFCPWGVRTFLAMKQAGYFEGFDWHVLSPYVKAMPLNLVQHTMETVGLSDVKREPPGGPAYLWEHTMRAGPSSIAADFKEFQDGRFTHRGKAYRVKWRVAPTDITYTVWVVSPMMQNLKVSDVVGYVTDTIQLLVEGWKALVIDKLKDRLIEYSSDEAGIAVYTSTTAIGHTMKTDKPNEISVIKQFKADVQQVEKDELEGILGLLEFQENEVLFESIDTKSDALASNVGDPATYTGGWMPPILIRADVVGWEDTGDVRFPREWHYFRYYEFDARGLAGVEPYNLHKKGVDSLANLSEFLYNDQAIQRSCWKVLPDTPRPIGTRLYLTDQQPNMQEIELSIGKATMAEWAKKTSRNTALVATIKLPDPAGGEYVMGELDKSANIALGFALVHDRVAPEAPFLKSVGWHARQSFPELFTQYHMRILVCRKGTDPLTGKPLYYFTEPSTVELATIPVRFVSRGDVKATGKLRFDIGGKTYPGVFAMSQAYSGASAQPTDMTAGSGPVLPRAIAIDSLYFQNGVLKVGGEFDLTAYLSPVEPGPYQLTVAIGPYTHHMWARVESHGGAAVFRGRLPAPPGRNTMTLAAQGAPSQTVTVERAAETVDLGYCQKKVADAQQEMSQATDQKGQLWKAYLYWDANVTLADELNHAGRYDEARQCALAVMENAPHGETVGADAGDRARWMRLREDALQKLCNAAYWSGDAATLGAAAPAYLKAEGDRMSFEIQNQIFVGGSADRYPVYMANEYADVIRKAAVSGVAPGVIANLEKIYFTWRQQAGAKLLMYDDRRYFYGQETFGQ